MQISAEFYEQNIERDELPHIQVGGIYEFPLYGLTDSPEIERFLYAKTGIGDKGSLDRDEVISKILRVDGRAYCVDCGFIFRLEYFGPTVWMQKGEYVKCPITFVVDSYFYFTHELKRADAIPALYRWRVDKIERLEMVSDETGMEIAISHKIKDTRADFDPENIDILTLTLLPPAEKGRAEDSSSMNEEGSKDKLN